MALAGVMPERSFASFKVVVAAFNDEREMSRRFCGWGFLPMIGIRSGCEIRVWYEEDLNPNTSGRPFCHDMHAQPSGEGICIRGWDITSYIRLAGCPGSSSYHQDSALYPHCTSYHPEETLNQFAAAPGSLKRVSHSPFAPPAARR